jgi:hypothetical protein
VETTTVVCQVIVVGGTVMRFVGMCGSCTLIVARASCTCYSGS